MGVPFNQAQALVGLDFDEVEGGDVGYLPQGLSPVGAKPEEQKQVKSFSYLAKAIDDIAVRHENSFGEAASNEFEREYRRIKGIIQQERTVSFAETRTINWASLINPIQEMFRYSGNNWRNTFAPLVSGIVEDTAQHWNTTAGIYWNVRNLFAEQWFNEYMLTFSDPITNTSAREIGGLLQAAIREGWTAPQMERELEVIFNNWRFGTVPPGDSYFAQQRLPWYRREMIARTETIRATNFSSWHTFRESGVVGNKEWLATSDARTRKSHALASGQVMPLNSPFQVGGELLQYPGDPSLGATPGNFVNCRCTVLPIMED
jgi:hypothetical protein